jgi:hypothetical protein
MNVEYLKQFEDNVLAELMRICVGKGMMPAQLLASDDIDRRWHDLAPEYMADAVKEIPHYPTVSVAWAGYLGMGVACDWDLDWDSKSNVPYSSYYGLRGFDDMDEHIMQECMVLAPESAKYQALEGVMQSCGETAVALIRHEHVEPQSVTAFHIYARTCHAMYRIGAALALAHMGYTLRKL